MSEVDRLSKEKYLLITTFRKNGDKVATPVWVTRDAEALYVITGAESGKVKRIRSNPEVELTPCDMRGRTRGETVKGSVELLDASGTAAVRDRVAKRYGLTYRIMKVMEKLRGASGESIGLRISPDS